MNDAVLMGQLSAPLALTIEMPMPGTLNQSAPAAAEAKVLYKTFASAAAGADWFSVPGMGISMVNAKGADSWPISTASFILMYKEPTDKAASAEALKFFDWSFKNGKKMAEDLDYVPLPDKLTDQIRSRVFSQVQK